MANGAKLAYVRVSTEEQNEALCISIAPQARLAMNMGTITRQVEALKQYDIDKWFIEKVSGKDMNRPKLREMLDYAREGDTIYIMDWSRISRSTKDLLELTENLKARGITLFSLKENIDTSTPNGRLMMTILASINQFERENMLERQREGIAIAKRNGAYKGRKKTVIEDMAAVYHDWVTRHKSKATLARENGVSRPTLDRLLKEYEREMINQKALH